MFNTQTHKLSFSTFLIYSFSYINLYFLTYSDIHTYIHAYVQKHNFSYVALHSKGSSVLSKVLRVSSQFDKCKFHQCPLFAEWCSASHLTWNSAFSSANLQLIYATCSFLPCTRTLCGPINALNRWSGMRGVILSWQESWRHKEHLIRWLTKLEQDLNKSQFN